MEYKLVFKHMFGGSDTKTFNASTDEEAIDIAKEMLDRWFCGVPPQRHEEVILTRTVTTTVWTIKEKSSEEESSSVFGWFDAD